MKALLASFIKKQMPVLLRNNVARLYENTLITFPNNWHTTSESFKPNNSPRIFIINKHVYPYGNILLTQMMLLFYEAEELVKREMHDADVEDILHKTSFAIIRLCITHVYYAAIL